MYAPSGVAQAVLNKALFVETGTYNDMVMRPYETTPDYQFINQFNEVTQGGSSVAPSVLSGVAGHFLKPSAQVQSVAPIDYGWDEPRLRFILDVSVPSQLGPPTRRIIQGYTGYLGVNFQTGSVDPNMPLYFNNILTLRQSQTETPYGTSIRTAVAEANHLLRGEYQPGQGWANPHYSGPDMNWTMRPEDVFTTMGRSVLTGMHDDVTDLRNSFADMPVKKSRRTNGSAPHYLSDVINGYRKTVDYGHHADAVDLNDVYDNARGAVQEDGITGDYFLHILVTSTTNFGTNGFVTYGELDQVLQGLDQQAVMVPASQRMSYMGSSLADPTLFEHHTKGQTEHWGGSNNETLWSTILSQSVPSLMMDLMLTKVAFVATNQTLDGSHDVRIMDAASFADGIDLSPYLEHFQARLVSEVLRGLSSNNHIDFNLQMIVDVIGETRVTISIAGGPEIAFANPSFCDGIFAPVLSQDSNSVDQVAHEIQSLVDNMGVQHHHQFDTNFMPTQGGGSNDGSI